LAFRANFYAEIEKGRAPTFYPLAGKNALQIIADQTKEFDFPVCFGFPVGHAFDNMTLVCGAEYKLAVTTQGSHLSLVSA